MYKILQRNTLIVLSQFILDLEKQGKTNHILFIKSSCIIIIQIRV